jgi:YrbI family 3-deoxy-D-manno-octulosonate 8-phosphate phosphatase
LCNKYNILLSEVAYLGDDINDLECIQNVGLGCCVPNAQEEVKQAAKFVTTLRGGEGAVREVCDYILMI